MNEPQTLYEKISRQLHRKYALQLLFTLFCCESILLIPLDPILALYVVQRKKDWKKILLIVTAGSVVAGLIGYALGDFLWDIFGKKIVNFLFSQQQFDRFIMHYERNQFLSVFTGCLLPLPFKLVTFSAGFCRLPLISFISALVLGRLMRFSIITYAGIAWGDQLIGKIQQHGKKILLLLAFKIVLALMWYLLVNT